MQRNYETATTNIVIEKPILTLYDVIIRSASKAVALQLPDGSMPPGHNGPYHDPETPVRNTSHWLKLFLKSYKISGEIRFRTAAENCIRYLLGTDSRPLGYTFWHRKNPEKDSCNGLIGQAWTLEALIDAGELLEMHELLKLSEEIFLLHPFDERRGLWQRVNIDGMILPFDVTFNHQLWFASVGGLLGKHSTQAAGQTKRFMEMLPVHLRIYKSGLIYHPLLFRFGISGLKRDLIRMIREDKERRAMLEEKAVGYHLFNLYAFGILREACPDHKFWRNRRFMKALDYAFSKDFFDAILQNPYGFPYNPPGFEMGYVMDQFQSARKPHAGKERWISMQLERCFNFDGDMMDRSTEDKATQSARLYEAVRVGDCDVTVSGEAVRQ